ncbi:PEGA domain-containing protein [Candidatus Roizmanbacteria bacterium]|nr:PEGA domain-containing protein [Candidatus Roizmanbacteria bacterium]
MKAKLTLLLILILLFAGFIFIRFFLLDQQNVYGKLKVISSPTSTVFVNNVAIGKTPFEDKYKVGEYILKLIPEGTATETASWNGKILIYKNALTYVNRELGASDITSAGEIFTTTKMEKAPKSGGYGEIYVETEPQGAIVTLDNDEKGVATVILSDVLRGDHELSVYMPGFFRRTQKINIDPGFRVNAYFKLAIDQSQKAPIPKPTEKEATPSAQTKNGTYIFIKETPQGWLRVRADASVDASESAKVKPGERYELLDEKSGWYKIKFNGNNNGLVLGSFTEGWVSSEFSSKE